MDSNRQRWNQGHQTLRRTLLQGDHQEAIELFLTQHAMVHSRHVSKMGLWSFEDEVLDGMTKEQIRCIPPQSEHSIAWIVFHLARIEDITMNLLVAGTPQLFLRDGWMEKLEVSVLHSGNSMNTRNLATLSTQIDIDALRAYRQAVGRRRSRP